ncbi:MAG: UpxY family transcription antiterminator [Bacteroidales bacterium]|nr:UpxY family transcription antiterminator [Bacteroidales bacterium]
MADDSKNTESNAVKGAAKHKSPAGGVEQIKVVSSHVTSQNTGSVGTESRGNTASSFNWYVALTGYNYERYCRDQIQRLGYEAYVASQKEVHVYSNRTRREVEKIVIPSLVFIRIPASYCLRVRQDCEYVKQLLLNRAATPDKYGHHPFAIIPDDQLQTLQFMLGQSERPVTITPDPLSLGDHVRILRGSLAGLTGRVTRLSGNSYIAVSLGLLGSALCQISATDVERIPATDLP